MNLNLKCISFVLSISFIASCTKNAPELIINTPFEQPLYLGKKIAESQLVDLCDETSKKPDFIRCSIVRDKLFANFVIKNEEIAYLHIKEYIVDDSPVAIEEIFNNFNIEIDPMRLKGYGDYYRLPNAYLSLVTSLDINSVAYLELHIAKEPMHLKSGSTKIFDEEPTTRASYGGFMLGKNLAGRNPVGYICETIKILDLTKCEHENSWYYEEEIKKNPDSNTPKKVHHELPDFLWLDKTEIVRMRYDFNSADVKTADKLISYYDGSQNFIKVLSGNQFDREPSIIEDDVYTIYKNTDIVNINTRYFYDSLSITLLAHDSEHARVFLENQLAISTKHD